MKSYSPTSGLRIINSGPVVVATCGPAERPNAITLAWSTVLSHTPALVGISVAMQHYSKELIEEHGAFIVNVPCADQLDAVIYCGTHSGRDGEKFAPAGITAAPGEVVPAAYIKEFPARLECEVYKSVPAGDHMFFIGEVKGAFADEDAFDGSWTLEGRGRTLHHLGGPDFGILSQKTKFSAGS